MSTIQATKSTSISHVTTADAAKMSGAINSSCIAKCEASSPKQANTMSLSLIWRHKRRKAARPILKIRRLFSSKSQAKKKIAVMKPQLLLIAPLAPLLIETPVLQVENSTAPMMMTSLRSLYTRIYARRGWVRSSKCSTCLKFSWSTTASLSVAREVASTYP